MPRKHSRAGIDTDIWALIAPNGDVRGGDYKPRVFWTKRTAELERRKFPECEVVRARIVLVESDSDSLP
jgi:hypothetical protein